MNKSVKPIFHQIAILSLGWLLSAPLYAQSDLPVVPVSQLSRPTGWQLVGSVSPTADGSSMRSQQGSNVLTGTSQPLTLLTPTDDFRLRFDLMLSPNADFVLTLPTGQAISFANSQDFPRLTKAPGLWQTVDVWYKTGSTKGPSILEKLALNGVTVREGQTLTNAKLGPLTVMAKTGTVAVRNVGYRIMSPRKVAQWSAPLSYTIVEGQYIQNREDARGKKVLKQDTTAQLNYEVSFGQPRQYTILFSGKLNALQAGDYQFELHQGGVAGVWVDGKEIIQTSHKELGQPSFGKATLTAGSHDVDVYFSRSWFRPGLGLYVSQAGTRPQPLHALASLPEPDPVAVVSVKPDIKSELIRSFVQMPGEKTKRTHSLSVGSPLGLHYTLDLDQMALLQVWKGDFADVTEMWYERGEPQLLSPMGVTVRLPAQTPLMVLTSDVTNWPDSVSENTLQYKGLTVDKQGMPTIEYTLAGTSITDAIRPVLDGPEGNALVRTLTLKGSPDGTPYCRVAAGASIDEISKGLYAINDRSYYIRIDPKAKIKLRQSNGKQELLMPVTLKNGTGSVQYSIVF